MLRSKKSSRGVKALAAAGAAGVAVMATAGPAVATPFLDASGNLANKNGGCTAKLLRDYFPPDVQRINNPITQAPEFLIRTWGSGACGYNGSFKRTEVDVQQLVNGQFVTVSEGHFGPDAEGSWAGAGFVIPALSPCTTFRAQTKVWKNGHANPIVTVESATRNAGKC